MTDAARTELSGAGRGNLPGMPQRQLTCAALGRGYPHSGTRQCVGRQGIGMGGGIPAVWDRDSALTPTD